MNKLSLKENDTLFNNQFKILKVIGNGGFSFVYHVKYLNMRDFAIKEFFISKYFQRAEDKKSVLFSKESNCKSQYSFKHNFFNEAILMKSFCHPNILSSFGYFEENNTIYRGCLTTKVRQSLFYTQNRKIQAAFATPEI